MRISDWSSDVCSSDLPRLARLGAQLGDKRVGGAMAMHFEPGVALIGEDGFANEAFDLRGDVRSDVGRARTGRAHAMNSARSEEHTSDLQLLMRISYALFCLNKHSSSCYLFFCP